MQVEYLGHFGDDLMVVNAARVSFNKESEYQKAEYITSNLSYEFHNCWRIEEKDGHNSIFKKIPEHLVVNRLEVQPGIYEGSILSEADQKLIKYLAKNGHWSPYSHPQLQVRVTAPIFVANQLKRSVVGLAINEVSRRYVDSEPEFYTPDEWRGRPPKSLKQGSGDEIITYLITEETVESRYQAFLDTAEEFYADMILSGVAPEMARMVLPQSMYTSWYWTGSLMAFLRVYKQRIDAHAQKESQIIAEQLGKILRKHFPVSFDAWFGG